MTQQLYFVRTKYRLHPGRGDRNKQQIHLVPAASKEDAAAFHQPWLELINGRHTAMWFGTEVLGEPQPVPPGYVWKGAAERTYRESDIPR